VLGEIAEIMGAEHVLAARASRPEVGRRLLNVIQRVESEAMALGVDIRAAALQFCAAHPVVAAVIPGAKQPDKVRENARLMAEPIPSALWSELKQQALLPAQAPTPA